MTVAHMANLIHKWEMDHGEEFLDYFSCINAEFYAGYLLGRGNKEHVNKLDPKPGQPYFYVYDVRNVYPDYNEQGEEMHCSNERNIKTLARFIHSYEPYMKEFEKFFAEKE